MNQLSIAEVVLAEAAVLLGAWVQGSVGFGSALLAAPLLALLDPLFVPGPVIMLNLSLTMGMALREWSEVDLRAIGWVVVGRVPGTALGLWALLALSPAGLGLLFALLVMVAVLLLALGHAPPRNRYTLGLAGLASGVMGVVTSIGGPPVALMFHDVSGPALRGTLSGFFFLSTLLSLLGLGMSGLLHWAHLQAYLLLVPGMLSGLWLSKFSRGYLDRGRTRMAVLLISGLSAVAVLLKYMQ